MSEKYPQFIEDVWLNGLIAFGVCVVLTALLLCIYSCSLCCRRHKIKHARGSGQGHRLARHGTYRARMTQLTPMPLDYRPDTLPVKRVDNVNVSVNNVNTFGTLQRRSPVQPIETWLLARHPNIEKHLSVYDNVSPVSPRPSSPPLSPVATNA